MRLNMFSFFVSSVIVQRQNSYLGCRVSNKVIHNDSIRMSADRTVL